MPKTAKMRFIPNCKLARLKPNPKNARTHEQTIDAVIRSIEAFNAVNPIIVNEDWVIAAGHARFKSATEMGLKTFPVLVVPWLTDEKLQAYAIADNQVATLSEWDQGQLAENVGELRDGEFNLEALGFNEEQISDILKAIDGADFEPVGGEQQGRLDQTDPITCPKCGHEFHR